MSALPSYRQYVLLGALPGWRAKADGLTEDASGTWQLDAVAGAAWPLGLGAAATPIALAVSPPGPVAAVTLSLLDAATQRIEAIDLTGHRPGRRLPGIGGTGEDPRHFHGAQDIALLPGGALAVADTGHGAIKLFSAYPHALLAVWGTIGRPARVAAGPGVLWVLDTQGKRVFGIDQDGARQPDLPGLSAPSALAADAIGQVAVIDGADIKLFASGGAPLTLGQVPGAAAITFGPAGMVHAGTTTGLIYGFAVDSTGWHSTGIGVLGQEAAITRLAWSGGTTLLALVRPPHAAAQLWRIDTRAAFVPQGRLAICELDSGITGCVWHRIALDADIPPGTSIEVRTEAYRKPDGASPPDLIPAPIVLAGEGRDCLVQGGPGRYLKLELTLRSNGAATPVLRGIRVWYPRDSWLNHLPAIFQENDESAAFLSRFLSILQTDFERFDETIDTISSYFDPASVPNSWFAWLAAWIALPIEPGWTDAQRRSVLKHAFPNYRRRGTPAGLEQLISDYAGVTARLVEHFRLRQLIVLPGDPSRAVPTGGGRLWSRDAYRRLQLGVYSKVGMFKLVGAPEPAAEPLAWGANEFSVFFDAEPITMQATRRKVAAVVEREKPAHTMATYRPVFARMRVGVQATLGVDTRVGAFGQAVLGHIATLGYDAILAPSPLAAAMQAIAAPTRPRLGVNTRLC